MAKRRSGLAARLREAVEREEGKRTAGEKERLAGLERARQARSELFEELEQLGEELGFVGVARSTDRLRFSRADRWLEFIEDGAGDAVVLDFEGRSKDSVNRLYREAALEDRWVWVRSGRGKEDRLLLFDQGLELLLVHALDLPSPDREVRTTEEVAADSPDDSTTVKRRL